MIRRKRKLVISPPGQRPHGFWYVAGLWDGCGVGYTFEQAWWRYFLLL